MSITKAKSFELLNENVDCFYWEYPEMAKFSLELFEHQLPIKSSFMRFAQGGLILTRMTK